ncbi:MAG: phosphoribosylanthranilate isomerase [Betaproteobacteria bacterium HGW-Betaproteobacteria-1]|nr:MAG: phosphoribosylanthranilate isomerase [Betaproteobacteria bacterium HGW-Betaproteobacteria-1]
MRTRVKICGITREEDARAAVTAGCDAIGLVFYRPSPRYVSPERAAQIVASLPPFVSVVGLFVDAEPEDILQVMKLVRLDLLQFHGNESPEACERFDLPYMKAIRVKPDTNLLQYAEQFKHAQALLLDAFIEGVPGGTGQVFDWNIIPKTLPLPVVLAGGLSPDNVEQAVRQVRPYAVDVSGGVELNKGIKDAAKIAAFMRGVSDASL